MDTKRLLTMMLIIGACMLILPRIFGGGGGATTRPAYPIYPSAATQPVKGREDGAKTQLITLGGASADSKDKVAVTINTETAGIEKVQLNINDYAQTVDRKEPLTLFQADPVLAKPFSTLGVHITVGNAQKELAFGEGLTPDSDAKAISEANGRFILDQHYVWKVVRQTTTDVDLSMSFQLNGKPLAELIKSFHVDPASYDVTITHNVRNLSDEILHVQVDQLGASDLPRDDPQQDDRVFHAVGLDSATKVVNSGKAIANITQIELPKVEAGTKPIGQMNDYTKDPFLWVASANRFFVTITRPLPSNPADGPRIALKGSSDTIPEVTHVARADLDLMKWGEKPADVMAVVRFTGAVVDVAPMTSVAEPLAVYMGPKKRDLLEGAPKDSSAAAFGPYVYQYMGTIQLSQGCYSYCTFDWLAKFVLSMLDFFKRTIAFGNYGVAIMILVIVVRAAMHPLTRASQINMAVMGKKMKDVAPLIDAVKKKYAGNKTKISEETMRVYRENKVNPAGGILGCLPMLIQMPIWAALYSGLRTDIDLRHALFIPGWINDLSHPDTIIPSALPVIGHPLFTLPLLGEIYGLNLLPLLLGAVFFFQMKVTTASQPIPADPQQAQMQNISKYMIFLFPLFLYSAPSGLNLYIFASTMGGLLDTWLVRKTLKKKGILPSTAQALPTHEEKVIAD